MVRQCAVENCKNTDASTIAHRFPRKIEHADQWRKSLNLQRYTLTELISKYVICTQHFRATDYRHCESNFLNFTAVPKLSINVCRDGRLKSGITSKLESLKANAANSSSKSTVLQQPPKNVQSKKIKTKSKTATNILNNSRSKKLPHKNLATSFSNKIKKYNEEDNVQKKVTINCDEFAGSSKDKVHVQYEVLDETEDPVKIIDTPFTLGLLHENVSKIDEMQVDTNEDDELPFYIVEEDTVELSDEICVSKSLSTLKPLRQYTRKRHNLKPETVEAYVSTTDDEIEVTDKNVCLLIYLSKEQLIEKLLTANDKISELEAKIITMENSQMEIKQKMELIQRVIQNQ